jgi:hypothetical protein
MNKESWLGAAIEGTGLMFFFLIQCYLSLFVFPDTWWGQLVCIVLTGIVIYAITWFVERTLLKKHLMNKGSWLGVVVIKATGWLSFFLIAAHVLFFVVNDPWWVKLVCIVLTGIVIYVITGLVDGKLLKKHLMSKESWLSVIIYGICLISFFLIETYVLFFVVTDPWWIKPGYILLIGIVIYVITGFIDSKFIKKTKFQFKKRIVVCAILCLVFVFILLFMVHTAELLFHELIYNDQVY